MGPVCFRRTGIFLSTCTLVALLLLWAGCGGGGSDLDTDSAAEEERFSQGSSEKPVSVPDAFPREGGVPLLAHLWDGGSFDSDGEIVKWEWNFTDGGGGWHDYTETLGDAWHYYTKPGTKAAQLRVTDNDGNTNVAHVKIEMRHGYNVNPVAVCSAAPTSGYVPLAVVFSADGSYDPDGEIIKYEWDFGEGFSFSDCSSTGGATTHTYTNPGDYTAILRVTDDGGAESTASVEISVQAGRGDWWMFGRDNRATFCSPHVGAQTPNLIWAYETSEGIITSNPSMAADGTIYIGIRPWIGSNPGKMVALNPNGSVKWEFPTDGGITHPPAVGEDGTLYVATYNTDLYAVRPDGTLKWTYDAGHTYTGRAPMIDNVDGEEIIYVSYCGGISALVADGTVKWLYEENGCPNVCAIGPDGMIYYHNGRYLRALNRDGTQSPNWNHCYKGLWQCVSVDENNSVVYALMQHEQSPNVGPRLTAINLDGTVKWNRTFHVPDECVSGWYFHPAVDNDGIVYLGALAADADDNLWAINPDGSTKWSVRLPGLGVWSGVTIGGDGTLYMGTHGAHAYAINSSDGSVKWHYDGGANGYGCPKFRVPPTISPDGAVYFGGYADFGGGVLLAFRDNF